MYFYLAWLQRTTDKFTYISLLCSFLTPELLLSIAFMFIWLLSGTVATFRIGFWLWQFDFPHAWLIASLISYRSLWEQMTTEIRKKYFLQSQESKLNSSCWFFNFLYFFFPGDCLNIHLFYWRFYQKIHFQEGHTDLEMHIPLKSVVILGRSKNIVKCKQPLL